MIDSNEIQDMAYDPTKVQRILLDSIKNGTTGDLTVVDPTNPFTMLLEATAVTTSSALHEMENHNRKVYPSLSRNMEDLYHHMTDEEERNIFATPSTTVFRMLVNVTNLKAYGISVNNNPNKKKMTIPKDTKILVSNLSFNIEYDIDILLLDGKSYVEQIVSSNVNSLSGIGSLPSVVSVDNQNVEWIIFDIEVKQFRTIKSEETIIRDNKFSKTVNIGDDQYYFSEATYGPDKTPLDILHSDTVIDHTRPSLRVEVLDNNIRYSLPSSFILSGLVTGSISIKTHVTRGKISTNLTKTPIESFAIGLPEDVDSDTKAVANNVGILAKSNQPIDGGISLRRIRDVRKKVINNTTGYNDLPITELQLAEKSKLFGFNIGKEVDTITERLYIATKNIDYLTTDVDVKTSMDVFTNRTSFIIEELEDTPGIKIDGEDIFIKSNTLFIASNGTVRPMSITESNYLESLSVLDKIDYVNNNTIFLSPFMYVIDTTLDATASRIYDMNVPSTDMLTILKRNQDNELRVNIGNHEINRTSTGYQITMNMLGNEKLDEITDFSNLYGMISLPIYDTSKYIYIKSQVNTEGQLIIDIPTDTYPDSNDSVLVDGIDNLGNNITSRVPLFSNVTLTLYRSLRTSAIDDFTKVNFIPGDNRSTSLTVESFELTMGKRIINLYADLVSEFTNRKYRKSPITTYKRYDEDVYLRGLDGCDVNITTDANGVCIDADVKLLHSKGDIVYEIEKDSYGNELLDENGDLKYIIEKDENGNPLTEEKTLASGTVVIVPKKIPVVENYEGDILLVDGRPIINKLGGINYFINILMIEYAYIGFNKPINIEYVDGVLTTIKNWLDYDLEIINDATLEHTKVEYTPNKSNSDVKLVDGSSIPYIVKPEVILYVDADIFTNSLTLDEMRSTVGKILHKYFSKKVMEMGLIRDAIVDTLPPGIVGVKVLNIVNGISDKEVYSVTNTSNRLSIAKKVDAALNVVYDIGISIESI